MLKRYKPDQAEADAPVAEHAAAGRLIHAASETCADLLYTTGFAAPDPFLWYALPGETGVVVSALEVGRAGKQVKEGITVLSQAQARARWQMPEDTRYSPETAIAALSRCRDVAAWQVPADFPFGLADKLQQLGVKLEPVTEFCPERRHKTPLEVEHLRAGVRLAEAGLDRALATLRAAGIRPDGGLDWEGEPLTAERLRGEVDAEIARRGGTASHTIVAPGAQGADPHLAGNGPLRADEPVVIDIFPRVDATGYFGDLTRTVVKGKAPEIVRQAFTAVRTAQARAIAQVRAGVEARAVHNAADDVFEAAGFRTDTDASPPHGFIHGIGHGLGLEIHEQPRVNAKTEAPLEPGQVITVEPGLYHPDWGGVRLEDVVVVRDHGCENLTTAPVALEID